MKPMLATDYAPSKLRHPIFVQPKMDGLRAILKWSKDGSSLVFTTRTGVILSSAVLGHLYQGARDNLPKDLILDGELYHPGWSLQRIMSACMRETPNKDSANIGFYIFDCLQRGSANASFEQRLVTLIGWYPPFRGKMHKVATTRVRSLKELDEHYIDLVQIGYEGAIVRHGSCVYKQGGRSPHLMKRKSRKDEDFMIIGVTEGKGKYEQMLGAFVCETSEGKTFTVGSGMTDLDRMTIWEALKNHEGSIIGEAKVSFQSLSDNGIPTQPTLVAYELKSPQIS